MHVKDVDVVCPELLQAIPYRNVHAFRRRAGVVALYWYALTILRLVASTKLGSNNRLIFDTFLLHPLSYQLL